VARRRGRKRGRGSFKVPIVSVAILVGQALYANSAGSSILNKVGRFGSMYTGYNFSSNAWEPGNLAIGYGPWVAKRFLSPFARPGRALGRMLPVSLS